MKRLPARVLAVLFLTLLHQVTLASPDSLKIVSRTNIGPVEYWFTESAKTYAEQDGSPLIEAIGPEHFPLLESMASAGRKTEGFKAYVISRVNFVKGSSFELMGVVINGELLTLTDDKKEVVKNFITLLSKNSVRVNGNVISAKR